MRRVKGRWKNIKKSVKKSRKRVKKAKPIKAKKIKPVKKVVLIVVDGMADTPVNGKTPLSVAKKPNMDWLAANGVCGELQLLPPDTYPASHMANPALLGYDPRRYYLRRGPLEAVGAGLPYKTGHLALRCNFATVDKSLIVKDRRAGRATYGLNEIARYINRHVDIGAKFVFIRTYEHRAVLIIKKQLSDKISTNDPQKTGKKVEKVMALENSLEASNTAKLVQEFVDKAHEVIEYHPKNAERIDRGLPPANYLLVRGAGNRVVPFRAFTKLWPVNNAVCIAENGVMKATCMLAGFNAITVPEMSAESTLNYIFDSINSALAEYDFVYAHIKPADEAGHDGDFLKKQRAIEAIDSRLESLKSFDGILVLTCDHITSCEHRKHMPGPVPVLVYGRDKDSVQSFDEATVKQGSLGSMSGRQLWKYVFSK